MPKVYNLKPGNILDVGEQGTYRVKAFVQGGTLSLSQGGIHYRWTANADESIVLTPGRWQLGWSGVGEGALLVYTDERPREVVYVDGMPTIGAPTHLELSLVDTVNRIPTTGGYVVQLWDLPLKVYTFSAEWLGLDGEQAALLLARLLNQPTYGKALKFAYPPDTELWLSGPPNIEVASQGNGYWDLRIQGVATTLNVAAH